MKTRSQSDLDRDSVPSTLREMADVTRVLKTPARLALAAGSRIRVPRLASRPAAQRQVAHELGAFAGQRRPHAIVAEQI